MAFIHSIHIATTVLALTAASAIRVQPRHDGRSHQGAHDAAAPELRPRQVNGPFGGIQPQSSRTGISPVSIATDAPVGDGSLTLTFTLRYDYVSSSSPSQPQPTIAPTGEVNPYIFPSSMIQVPVATICPDTPIIPPNTTASSGPGLVNATAFLPNGSSTVYLLTPPHPTNTSGYNPVPLSSPVSVCYPEIDSNCPSDPDATFSVTPIPLPSANAANATFAANNAADRVIPDPTARILLDSNGCQTIYSPSYSAVCRTTVKVGGMPEATVTDCGQWVTFSSDTGGCGPATPVVGAADSVGIETGAVPQARDEGGDDYRASITGTRGVTPSVGEVQPTVTVKPGMYYAAHWVDLARGGVPANVRVEECEGQPITCQIFREEWSESKITGVVRSESVAQFSGVS